MSPLLILSVAQQTLIWTYIFTVSHLKNRNRTVSPGFHKTVLSTFLIVLKSKEKKLWAYCTGVALVTIAPPGTSWWRTLNFMWIISEIKCVVFLHLHPGKRQPLWMTMKDFVRANILQVLEQQIEIPHI